jgi:hypothetical protein
MSKRSSLSSSSKKLTAEQEKELQAAKDLLAEAERDAEDQVGLRRMTAQKNLIEARTRTTKEVKRDKARDLGLARDERKRELQNMALTKPGEFYDARNDEYAEMNTFVLNMYDVIFEKYSEKQYSDDDANAKAEKVAKALKNTISEIIEEDYGGLNQKNAASRQAIASAANTIGKGGMQLKA